MFKWEKQNALGKTQIKDVKKYFRKEKHLVRDYQGYWSDNKS